MKNSVNNIKFNSHLILTIIILSFISLCLNYITNGLTNNLIFTTYRGSLLNPMTYVRMIMYPLGHANFNHWYNNMLLLLIIGPMLEEKYGTKKLLIMILITTIIISVSNNIFFNTGLLGASGIVFMMIVLSSFTNFKDGQIPLTFILVLILYLGKELVSIFTNDNISQMAHIIGGVCGLVYGFIFIKTKKE